MSKNQSAKPHTIRISRIFNEDNKKWIVRVEGLPSFEVDAADADNMSIRAEFDASRFIPYIQTNL